MGQASSPAAAALCHAPNCCFQRPEDVPVDASSHQLVTINVWSNGEVSSEPYSCAEIAGVCCADMPVTQRVHPIVLEGETYLDIHRWSPEGQVDPVPLPRTLTVPPAFRTIAYDWALPTSQQGPLQLEQEAPLQLCLKLFLREMLDGVHVQLRLDDHGTKVGAQSIEAVVSLTHDLANLRMKVNEVERVWPLKDIRSVLPSQDSTMQGLGLPTGTRERNVLLWFAQGQFLCLRFFRHEQAKFFGTCLQLLLKAEGQTKYI